MMKTLILKIKNHLIGFLAGVFAATAVTAFAASNPWSIGSLFTDIGGGIYKLIGTNIKDGSITPAQIGFNYAGSTSKWWSANSVSFNNGLTTTSRPTFAGITTTNSIRMYNYGIIFPDGTYQSTAASYAPPIVGNWVNVVNNRYAPGPWNRYFNWNSITLDSTKKLLGLRMSGSSDDGGACRVFINWYFAAAITHYGYISQLGLYWDWLPYARNNGAWPMASATFLFDSIPPGISLWVQDTVIRTYIADSFIPNITINDATAYNKWFVWGYLPAGLQLGYSQWYNDWQWAYYNNCVIDALYSAN